MNFVSYDMQALGRTKDKVDNIRIIVSDGINSKYVGDARMISFENIWLELPEVTGRYSLKSRAIKELDKHGISSLDELFSKAWLVDNGGWILHNMVKIN